MNILIPMAGAGSRFAEKGYTQHKPVIPTTNRRTGKKMPMVVVAVSDLPCEEADKARAIFIIRNFHKNDKVDGEITAYYPQAQFIVIDRLTEGQASTCLLAKHLINNPEPLIIAACDNGMDVYPTLFKNACDDADAVIFTFRHNAAVSENPKAYGWIKVDEGDFATGVSIKKPVSETPMNNHAVVGTFWFKHGKDFVEAAETMIADNERINGEFYVDQVFRNMLERGKRIKVFEVDRYICWGTPKDYEEYEQTLSYWKSYMKNEPTL